MKNPKILIFDLETLPITSYNWGIWDQNAIAVIKEWELASFAWKFLGDKKTQCLARPDLPGTSDKELVKALHKLMEEADILVAHNGDSFDIKKAKARFAFYKLPPVTGYQSIDTRKQAKKHFAFTSNSLNGLGEFLGLGKKVHTGGFDLWLKCMKGDKKAWAKMKKYNVQDVVLLEKVYLRLRPWITHPNVAIFTPSKLTRCPRCNSSKFHGKGLRATATRQYQRYVCLKCGGHFNQVLASGNKSGVKAI